MKAERQNTRKHYLELLSKYLLPQRKTLIGLTVLLFISIGMQLINPQIIRYFIDSAGKQGDMTPLFIAAGLFMGFSLIGQAVSVLRHVSKREYRLENNETLRGDLAAHCLSLDMSFHKSHTSGAIIERVDGDVNALANFFSSMMIHLLGNVLLMIGIIVLLFRENWLIGAGMSCFSSLPYLLFSRFVNSWRLYGDSGGRRTRNFTGLLANRWKGRRIFAPMVP